MLHHCGLSVMNRSCKLLPIQMQGKNGACTFLVFATAFSDCIWVSMSIPVTFVVPSHLSVSATVAFSESSQTLRKPPIQIAKTCNSNFQVVYGKLGVKFDKSWLLMITSLLSVKKQTEKYLVWSELHHTWESRRK